MPRPSRSLWVPRTYARRRHRSWMLAMIFASLGWGTWWSLLVWVKFTAQPQPSLLVPGFISTSFAVLGLLVSVLTLRARRSWILCTCVPLLANLSLFFVPWLARTLFESRSL